MARLFKFVIVIFDFLLILAIVTSSEGHKSKSKHHKGSKKSSVSSHHHGSSKHVTSHHHDGKKEKRSHVPHSHSKKKHQHGHKREFELSNLFKLNFLNVPKTQHPEITPESIESFHNFFRDKNAVNAERGVEKTHKKSHKKEKPRKYGDKPEVDKHHKGSSKNKKIQRKDENAIKSIADGKEKSESEKRATEKVG